MMHPSCSSEVLSLGNDPLNLQLSLVSTVVDVEMIASRPEREGSARSPTDADYLKFGY
jgi:hypothetical protein